LLEQLLLFNFLFHLLSHLFLLSNLSWRLLLVQSSWKLVGMTWCTCCCARSSGCSRRFATVTWFWWRLTLRWSFWTFVLLEHVIIICSKFPVNNSDGLRQLSNELSWPAAIDCIRWDDSIRRKNWIIKNLRIVMYLWSVTDDTILANLNTVSDFKCANDCIFVDVDIVSNSHLYVLKPSLILLIGWSNNTIFSYNNV
jgi:hypothetical protein